MTLSRLSALSGLSSLSSGQKLQSVLLTLPQGTVLANVQFDNGLSIATATFLSYDQLTGVVTFSVGGVVTLINASDIQLIQR